MTKHLRGLALILAGVMLLTLSGCGDAAEDDRQIIRIGHNQSTNHPTHIALTAFEEFIESRLGDKYNVEVYPSELLGSHNEMVQLTQTGAINFCVASNSLLETFSSNYSIFNLPYLFSSSEAYHAAMDDEYITGPIFKSTKQAGFEAVTWIDAGIRNFYTVDRPINSPADLKGLKIRTQQSPTNVEMMRLLGGSATPMGFGEVCKYYSYDMHQMIPDILIGNVAFLDSLSEEERAIFEEGFLLVNQVEREEWTSAIENAKERAQNQQGVQFNYPDTAPFQEACAPLHESMLASSPNLVPIYEAIQAYNAQYPSTGS